MTANTETPPRAGLVVSAHSADFVWRSGGAIATHVRQGYRMTVVCLSFGERGESAKLWRKGETSGNVQHVVSVTADCDGDALVVEVIKDGPACHLGTDSCFANLLFRDEEVQRFSLEALYALLEGRNAQRPEGSYTTYLFEKGREKILKKVGEECTEVIIGAMKGSREETIYEISDLCYHVLVLMVAEGITLDDIRAELASRHVIDHKVKQETMQ